MGSDHVLRSVQLVIEVNLSAPITRTVSYVCDVMNCCAISNPKIKPAHAAEDALDELVLSAGITEVPIETRSIRGATGLAASDFVRSVEADLLVVSLPKGRGSVQQMPGNIAWVSDVIPCNLWVIR